MTIKRNQELRTAVHDYVANLINWDRNAETDAFNELHDEHGDAFLMELDAIKNHLELRGRSPRMLI